MFAYDHNHVAVLVCGRFGRHSEEREIEPIFRSITVIAVENYAV